MNVTRPRGTQDYIFELEPGFDIVAQACKAVAQLNGYYRIKTPVFEHRELFIRTVGETSDIVNKEFYDFKDKSDRALVLRPELTASVCRSVVENKLLNKMPLPIKLFYFEPMFRYERPQSGRLRMFHQFGIECVGSNSYCEDIEMILMAKQILDFFELKDYTIKINNICSSETRKKWIVALKKYFKPYLKDLTEDSQKRLDKNPLRILDDKIDGKKDFVLKAPKCVEFATKEEIDYFGKITKTLKGMGIKFVVDETLVRGLDYYCNFIFEIESKNPLLKGQPTLVGGGRYNTMIKELGGQDANCVGFAIGIERLLIALTDNKVLKDVIKKYKHVDVAFANLIKDGEPVVTILESTLRKYGISVSSNLNTNKLDKHFKYAQAQCADYVVIIGQKELDNKKFIVKDQKTMKQEEVGINDLVKYFLKKKGVK